LIGTLIEMKDVQTITQRNSEGAPKTVGKSSESKTVKHAHAEKVGARKLRMYVKVRGVEIRRQW